MERDLISVCICTYKRPEQLARLLQSLEHQVLNEEFLFDVVVVDNDKQRSAEAAVRRFKEQTKLQVCYDCEPEQNIALTRNRAIGHASGSYIAFIDDDEFPDQYWLLTLLRACIEHCAQGVLGPVRPHFEQEPPSWIIRGRFCERREFPTGTPVNWQEGRTGNLLFRRIILDGVGSPFRPEFGTGGEDNDFLRRMSENNHRFVWCNEAVVWETVPPERWTRSYMLRRALWRGSMVLRHPTGRTRLIATSLIAVPIYAAILPPMLLLGQHWFMKFCIKLSDHAGRLLALVGMNPVSQK